MIETAQPMREEPPEPRNFRYTNVVFGHPARSFDRDQLITYFLARRVGLLTPDAPIRFSSRPTADEHDNPATLVVEGLPYDDQSINKPALGNFDNGPHDEPAAAMFHQRFSREFGTHQDALRFKDLVTWLTALETGRPVDTQKLTSLSRDDLARLTDIFYGIKHRYQDNPTEVVHQAYKLLDNLFDANRTETLSSIYSPILKSYEPKQRKDQSLLEARAQNPQALRSVTTIQGMNLTYFDVRGLEVDSGAVALAQRLTNADMVVVINDEADDKNQVIGTKISIKIPKEKMGKPSLSTLNLRTLLSERLNRSEALFGRGYKFTASSGFGGHPGVIGSPTGEGTHLKPENVWIALQDFFNVPRYSSQQFRAKAAELATRLNCSKYFPDILQSPEDEYTIAKRVIEFHIPTSDREFKIVTLNEDDIPLYETVFTSDNDNNRKLLLKKSNLTEPEEVAAIRSNRAQTQLERYLQDNNAVGVLTVLNDLNPQSIKKLLPATLLRLLSTIAQDPDAIAQVWDKDNLRFRITTNEVPREWILSDIEQYKAARYRYLSLPKKIDRYFIDALHDSLTRQSPKAAQEYGNQLLLILSSDTYRQAHQADVYDQLLQSTLRFVSDRHIDPAVRMQIAERLVQTYGIDMASHWKSVAQTDSSTLTLAQTAHPETIGKLLDSIDITVSSKAIADVPKSTVIEPDEARIRTHLERQSQVGLGYPAIATVLVQIGRRIEHMVKDAGIYRLEHDEYGNPVHERDIEFDALLDVDGLLRLDRDHLDHVKVAHEIVRIVKALAAKVPPETRIRIIRGSFPNKLGTPVAVALMKDPLIAQDLDRIVWCDYNMQDGDFSDSPFGE